jgi:hypothetical protein
MLRFLRRTAMVKGVLGGDRRWFAVWSALAVARLARRLTSDAPEVVYRRQLDPGEALLIRTSHAVERK